MPVPAPALTVIIPAFDESLRIESPLREIGDYLASQDYSADILVVDDGSRDDTGGVVREIAAGLPVPLTLLRYSPNRGKGHALKVGFAHSRGDRVLFTDVDLSTPIDETARLLAALDEDVDVVIGSRKLAGAQILQHQPWYREQMGRFFTLLVRLLIVEVSDVTCGFKLYRGDAGRDLFSRVRVYDWSFDAEALWIGRERGLRVREVPVRWHDQAGTKVSLLRDTLRSLQGLARIRINAALSRYARASESDSSIELWQSERADSTGEPSHENSERR